MKRSASVRIKNKGFLWAVALAALALLVAVNIGLERLDSSAFLRIDLSPDKVTELSEGAKAALAALQGEATFTVARKTGASDELSVLIDELLSKMEAQSGNVRVKYVDPELEPYSISELDKSGAKVGDNTVYVTLGNATRRIDGDAFLYTRTLDGQAYRLFCGDARLTGALNALTSGEVKRAAFLTGHGETPLDECATLALALNSSGFDAVSARAPESGDVLFVLAPKTDLTREEAIRLADFLDNGGAMLFACDAQAPLGERFASLLDLYGLGFEQGAVVESVGESERYIDLPDRLCPIAGESELLAGVTERLILPSACAIAAPRRLGDIVTETLLTTSPHAYRKGEGNASLYAFETGDTSGTQTLAMSAESLSGGPRIVLLGSVRMLTDSSAVTGAGVLDASDNLAFLDACAAWLGGGEAAYATADLKVLPNHAMTFDSEAERERVVWLSVAALPTVIALVALVSLALRRRKVR